MFTGIIESLGEVRNVVVDNGNIDFTVEAKLQKELKVDQSVSHNGVCLTVTHLLDDNQYVVTAIKETLDRSNLGSLRVGNKVNLERCMVMNGRLDGHIVQGHVDQTGTVKSVKFDEGSWIFSFEYDSSSGNLTVEKGSICVNGVSLTVVDSGKNDFSVAIIPFTYEHTNFCELKKGDQVNLEFDILGKYLKKYLDNRAD